MRSFLAALLLCVTMSLPTSAQTQIPTIKQLHAATEYFSRIAVMTHCTTHLKFDQKFDSDSTTMFNNLMLLMRSPYMPQSWSKFYHKLYLELWFKGSSHGEYVFYSSEGELRKVKVKDLDGCEGLYQKDQSVPNLGRGKIKEPDVKPIHHQEQGSDSAPDTGSVFQHSEADRRLYIERATVIGAHFYCMREIAENDAQENKWFINLLPLFHELRLHFISHRIYWSGSELYNAFVGPALTQGLVTKHDEKYEPIFHRIRTAEQCDTLIKKFDVKLPPNGSHPVSETLEEAVEENRRKALGGNEI
jgi:hypothetical protein